MPEHSPTPTPTTTTAAAATAGRAQLRTLPLSRLTIAEGFNPRQAIVRDTAYDALVATVRERGLLQSLRVRETDGGDYVVIAGHRASAPPLTPRSWRCPASLWPPGPVTRPRTRSCASTP